jgi:hypothetical protein
MKADDEKENSSSSSLSPLKEPSSLIVAYAVLASTDATLEVATRSRSVSV